MASSTMYGNTLQYGKGNHMVVPTFALQNHYAERSPAELQQLTSDASLLARLDAHLVDAFGGGILRVDSTTSTVMRQLAPAEATKMLPPRARELLRKINATDRYFELYAARNYFERPVRFGRRNNYTIAGTCICGASVTNRGCMHGTAVQPRLHGHPCTRRWHYPQHEQSSCHGHC